MFPDCYLFIVPLYERTLVLIKVDTRLTDVYMKPGRFFLPELSVFVVALRLLTKPNPAFYLFLRSGSWPAKRQRGGCQSTPADDPMGDVRVCCDAMPQLQSDGV